MYVNIQFQTFAENLPSLFHCSTNVLFCQYDDVQKIGLAKQKSRKKQKLLENVNDKSMTSQPCQGTDIDIEEDKDNINMSDFQKFER